MANEFKVITTQAELDAVIGERLNRQKQQYEDKLKDYDSLKEQITNLQNELEDKQRVIEANNQVVESKDDEFSKLKSELNELKLNNLKTSIAIKSGLPYEMAARLRGEDEDSILEDAKTLSGLLSSSKPKVAPLKDLENPTSSSEDSAYKDLVEKLKGD